MAEILQVDIGIPGPVALWISGRGRGSTFDRGGELSLAERKPKKKRTKRANAEGSVYETTVRKTRADGTIRTSTVYRGYITLDIVGGKQKRKYVSAGTRAEATSKIRELQNRRDEGTLSHTAGISVETWVTHYLTVLAPKKPIKGRKGNTRSTLATYKGYARNHVFPRIGKKSLESLMVEDLEAVYEAMAEAGMASSSIHQCHSMMRSALDVAWKRGRMPRNVAALVMLPSGAQPEGIREVTVEEMQATLVRANERRMAARWVTRLAYGIRQGECLGLSWDDVDFTRQIIHIRQQLQRDRAEHGCGAPIGTYLTPITHKHGCGEQVGTAKTRSNTNRSKDEIPLERPQALYPCGMRQVSKCPLVITGGGQERPLYPCGKKQPAMCALPDPKDKKKMVSTAIGGGLVLVPVKSRASQAPLPLPKQIADLLKARKKEQARERIQEGPRWSGWIVNGKQANLVFTQPNGRPLDCHDDWEEWYELLAEAGVKGIKPHAARHWAATMLVALGVHPRVAMEMLRHADVSTTLNLYAHAPSEDLRAAADALAEALLGKVAEE